MATVEELVEEKFLRLDERESDFSLTSFMDY